MNVNYQTLINEVLREYIQHKDESLEALFRRVLREELTPKKRTYSIIQQIASQYNI